MILNYDKKKGFTSIIDSFKELTKEDIPDISEEVKSAFSKFDADEKFTDMLAKLDYDAIKDNGFNKWLNDLEDLEKTTLTVADALNKYKKSVIDASETTTRLGKVAKSAGNVLKTLGSFAVNTLALIAITKGIELAFTAIDNYIHRVEIAIEKGEEAREKLSSIYEEYDSASSVIEGSGERFGALREGVNVKTNENISLTNEEYSEYLSLCNQIADVYPQLVTSYDAQGNAILNLGTDAETATEQLDALLEKQQQVAYNDAKEEIGTALTGSMASIGEYKKQLKGLEEDIASTDEVINLSTKQNNILAQLKSLYDTQRLEFTDATQDVVMNTVMPHLVEHGIDFAGNRATQYDDNGNIIGYYEDLTGFPATQEEWDAIIDEIGKNLELEFPDVSNSSGFDKVQLLGEKSGIESQIQSEWDTIVSDIQKFVKNEANYNALSTEMQELIQQSIANTDMSMFPELSEDEYAEYIENTYIRPISDLYNSKSTEAHIVKAKTALANLYNLGENVGTLNVNEYDEQLNAQLSALEEYWKTIKGEEEGEEFYKEFVLRFGFKVEDEDGNLVDANDTLIENIKEKASLNGEDISDIDFESLTVKQLVAIEAKVTDSSYGGTVSQAVEDETKKVQESINSSEITFSSILSSEDITKQVDDFQSNISSLDDALETLRNGEEIDFTDLVQEFPELAGQTDNLQQAISNLKTDKLREFSAQWKTAMVDLTGEEAVKAQQFLENIISSMDFSDVDLSNYQSIVRNNLSAFGGTGSGSSPLEIWNQLFEKYGNTAEGREALIKLSADPSNVYKTFDELDKMASKTSLEIKVETDAEIITNNTKLLAQIETAKSALSSQATGQSISIDAFTAEGMEDYQSALEYVNGTMQLNAEMIEEITKAKAEEQIAINDVTKAQKQAKYLENAAQIETLRQKIEDNNFATGESADSIQLQIDSLLESNDVIVNQCGQLDILNASLRESIGTYQAWKDAQNASESGDMFDDTLTALQQIDDVINNTDSDLYGRVGRDDYKTSLDLVIPETVNKEDTDAVNNYLDSIYSMFTHDEDGDRTGLNIENFCQEAVDKGLMVLDEAGESYQVAGGKTMEDFAEGLNLAMPLVQAMFGEMEEFGGKFDWADEAVQTIGDLGVTATEAAESLRGIEGNETLKINLDVSDIESKEDKISALDATIQEMDGVKSKVGVDASEIEYANSIIQYCVAQKQQLNEPAVMSVDTSLVQGKVGEAVALLQQFQTAQNELEMQASVGMDTSEAQANVDALAQQIQGLDANVTAALNIDTTSIDTINASLATMTPELLVKAGIDESAIIGYSPENKNATVIYRVDHSAVDLYNPQDLTRTVTYNVVTNGTPPSGGTIGVNGTANASGTANNSLARVHSYGRAMLNGDWGTKKSGTTLVGELGREIVVDPRTGRWYTVGDNGAEFVNIPKNAIVFNHIQSQSLLEQGYVAARGTALAGGNANLTGTAMVTGGIKVSQTQKSTENNTTNNTVIKQNTAAVNKNTQTQNKNTKTQTKNLETFQKWLDKIKDWVEVKLQRLQEKIDLYSTKADNATGYEAKNNNLETARKTAVTLQKNNQAGIVEYEEFLEQVKAEAVSSELLKGNNKKERTARANTLIDKIKSGTININEYGEKERQFIETYSEWYQKIVDCTQAIEDAKQTQKELAQQKLDNISEEYDALITQVEHTANLINGFMEQSELKGYRDSAVYYDALIANAGEEQQKLIEKRAAMMTGLQKALKNGDFDKDSIEYLNAQNDIDAITESIQEMDTNILTFIDNKRQLKWDEFDDGIEAIDRLVGEAEFLQKVLSYEDMYTDSGSDYTDAGMANLGLNAMNYNVSMAEADKIKAEIAELDKEYAGDKNNVKYLERRNELLDEEQNYRLAALEYEQAMIDAEEERYNKQLENLQKIIDKTNEAKQSQKDLNDYQKDVSEKATEVDKLERMAKAWANNDSEEGKLKYQQYSNDLKKAQEELEETEYEKYLSDSEELLSNIYTQAEEFLNEKLDNRDALFQELMTTANENATSIGETLEAKGEEIGYDLSSEMESIWGDGGNAYGVLTTYTSEFSTTMTNVQTTLNNILSAINAQYKEADANASSNVDKTSDASYNPQVTPSAKTTTTSSTSSGESKSSEDEILKIINSGKSDAAYIKEQRKKKKHSDLWKYIVDKYGHVPTYAIYKKLGKKLGVKAPKGYKVKSETNALLKALKKKGYATGTRNTEDEWSWIHDNELIIRKSDGAILKPTGSGAAVFNSDATNRLYDFANNPAKYMSELSTGNLSDIPNANNSTSNNASVSNEITFNLPEVTKPEDFMNWMIHDKQAQQALQDMIVSPMNGKSQLKKYRNKF